MVPLSRRLALSAPALALTLAACGSPAINTSGIGLYHSTSPSAGATGPSAGSSHPSGSTSTASAPHPTSSASRTTVSTAPTTVRTSSAPHVSPTHTTSVPKPTCLWQPGRPSVLVTPCFGLTSGQTVTVRARGLTVGWGVIAIECVDKGTATDQNDCDLNGAGGLGTLLAGGNQPNGDGTITLTLKVNKTFTGGGGATFTCGGSTHCIVAVTSPQHTSENATAPITFR